MEEDKVVVKKRRVSRTKKPMQQEATYVRGPGILERTLMCLAKILTYLLNKVEKKIVELRGRRLARQMDGDGPDKI